MECIGYQITDIVEVMGKDSGIDIGELRVDGGPTKNSYLMQFQSDMARVTVQIPEAEELSGIGAAYAAGLSAGVYEKETLFARMKRSRYEPKMDGAERERKYQGWKDAVSKALTKK